MGGRAFGTSLLSNVISLVFFWEANADSLTNLQSLDAVYHKALVAPLSWMNS